MFMIRRMAFPAICLVVLLFFECLGFLSGMNHYSYDLAFRLRGSKTPHERILIVAIDEKTLATIGRWPIKRSIYAAALEKMKTAEAVAFDVLMSEPSGDDDALAAAINEHGAVILPVIVEENMTLAYPSETLAPFRTGHVHIEKGIDGIAREIYHTLYFKDRFLPSLTSVLYETAGKISFPRTLPPAGQVDDRIIHQCDLMRINFYGGPGVFPRVSLLDVVNGACPPSFFSGKIVLVGATAMGLGDSAMTPFSQTRLGVSGVEIHANILNNLFMNDAIQVVPFEIRWIIVPALALFMYALFLRSAEGRGVIFWVAAVLLYSLCAFLLFSQKNIWHPPAWGYAAFLVFFAAAYIVKLQEAAASLGTTYDAIQPHLRRLDANNRTHRAGKGLMGLFTPRGIQSQALLLNKITHQLIFEKELSDRILLSDVFGVAVFDSQGALVMANRNVQELCRANAIDFDNRDRFIMGFAPFILEKDYKSAPFEQWVQKLPLTAALTQPVRQYLKVDASILSVGENRYALFLLINITKIKEVEILKGQIVSIVSHELKTPMTNIMGFSEILVEELEGELRQFAGVILEESERLSQFVNTFLDINRIEEGRQRISKVSTPIADLVEEAVLTLSPLAKKTGMRLAIVKPASSMLVTADRNLTKQCLINLVENAFKYSPPDREAKIEFEETADDIRIHVMDQGYGIRKDDLERIFEKFYRSTSDATAGVKGSGLGLSFVKEAMEAQGGRILVHSIIGKGSTFSLVFPKAA